MTRERLVRAALELVQDEGLDGLSMRALAERLEVKAASLYWHVRDRRELLELLAEALLDGVPMPAASAGWRKAVAQASAAVAERVGSQKDGARIVLEAPDVMHASDVFAAIRKALTGAGLAPGEAGDVAQLVMAYSVGGRESRGESPPVAAGSEAAITIDSGSRGVALRAGSELETLFRIPRDRGAAAPAIVRGETVIVRRIRGVGMGEIELSRRHPWRVRIQGPTWNTVVDASGLELREIKLDGGAARVECYLSRPRGVVPIIVSGGVVGVALHRPAGVAVVADVSTGAVKLKLDRYSTRATVQDLHWQSDGASSSADRYALRISGGAVQVTLDSEMSGHDVDEPLIEPPAAAGQELSALEILLAGVEARVTSR